MTLLNIDDARVEFPVRGASRTQRQRVLNGVSLQVNRGEVLGLLGESGSGKSTLGRAILGLEPLTSGSITLNGKRIDILSRRQRRKLSTRVQAVFQDPRSSLNPRLSISDIIAEPLYSAGAHGVGSKVAALLDAVHLPADAAARRPGEFSGGQRQRVAIARAISVDPDLIICDEPVSALDMVTQSRILDLLVELRETTQLSMIFISHDLTAVRRISNRISVLAGGRIIEEQPTNSLLEAPREDFTKKLIFSVPLPDPGLQTDRRKFRAVTA